MGTELGFMFEGAPRPLNRRFRVGQPEPNPPHHGIRYLGGQGDLGFRGLGFRGT